MSGDPTPVGWRTLPRWLRVTKRLDRSLYQARSRPTSLRRVLRGACPDLRRPVFVVGAPRSGTSFLGDAIGVLPEVSYHYEPPITKAAARYVYDGLWSHKRARFFYRRVYAWLMRAHLDGDLRFCEKTPQNCFIMPFLDTAFDDARFVHIIRDGRDAALSYSKKPWLQSASKGSGKRESGGYLIGPTPRFWVEPRRRAEFEATTDLHRCAWAWRRFTEAALGDGLNLDEEKYFQVRYEKLVDDPRGIGDRLLDFLEVTAPDSRAAFHAALAEARPDSVGRWRGQLRDDDLELLQREAGSLLRTLGYES